MKSSSEMHFRDMLSHLCGLGRIYGAMCIVSVSEVGSCRGIRRNELLISDKKRKIFFYCRLLLCSCNGTYVTEKNGMPFSPAEIAFSLNRQVFSRNKKYRLPAGTSLDKVPLPPPQGGSRYFIHCHKCQEKPILGRKELSDDLSARILSDFSKFG